MTIKERAMAGTLESSDIQIVVEPYENGIEIELESVVLKQYGNDIKKVIRETVKEFKVDSVKIHANDKGAITPVIKSRVQAAIFRGLGLKKYDWKQGE